LTNHGSTPVTYQLQENGGVLTETVAPDNSIHSQVIDGANLTYSTPTITLQSGESQTVDLTLALPSSFTQNAFVEGFLTFVSQSVDHPDLSIPYMGYHGTFASEPMIDQPAYEEGSYLGASSLLAYYGGSTNSLGEQNGQINPENIAISPDQDGFADEAIPYLLFLRNSTRSEERR